MAYKVYCPKCNNIDAIYYGKRRLQNKTALQRIYCRSCKKTTTLFQESFFKRMRVTPDKFDDAIGRYNNGIRIIDIAHTLKTRPNTIIDWIRKVHDDPNGYNSYLKNVRKLDYNSRRQFFRSLLRTGTKQKSRSVTQEHLKRLQKVTCWPYIPEFKSHSEKMNINELRNPSWE